MPLPLLLVILSAVPLVVRAHESIPRCTTVEPSNGKSGDILTVNGENLSSTIVAELYFTDGKDDIKAAMLEQTATAIKFKVPAKIAAGRWRLMVLTKGKEPKLIEQPVRVEIE